MKKDIKNLTEIRLLYRIDGKCERILKLKKKKIHTG